MRAYTNYKTTLTLELYGSADTQVMALEKLEELLRQHLTAFAVAGTIEGVEGLVHPHKLVARQACLFARLRIPFKHKMRRGGQEHTR